MIGQVIDREVHPLVSRGVVSAAARFPIRDRNLNACGTPDKDLIHGNAMWEEPPYLDGDFSGHKGPSHIPAG